MKVIEIRLTDEQYQRFHAEVGEIVSLAAYMEATVRIRQWENPERVARLTET